jgi:hypothetical protein
MLLIVTEAGLLFTLARVADVAFLTLVSAGLTGLLLHLSRGEVIRGVFDGAVMGGLLLVPLLALRRPSSVALEPGLLIVITGALYGGTLHAIFKRNRMPYVPKSGVVLLIAFVVTVYLIVLVLPLTRA